MLTMSKDGIFKPKAYAVVKDNSQKELPSFTIASKFPQLIEAMDFEYASLQKQ